MFGRFFGREKAKSMDSKLNEKAEEQLDSKFDGKPTTVKLDREELDEVAGGAKVKKSNDDGPIELPAI